MKTLQEKIQELEMQGWEYDDDFRIVAQGNTLVSLIVLKRDGYYRSIDRFTKKINRAKKYMEG